MIGFDARINQMYAMEWLYADIKILYKEGWFYVQDSQLVSILGNLGHCNSDNSNKRSFQNSEIIQ